MHVAALAASVWQNVVHTATFPTPTWERVVWQISCGSIRSRCAPFRRGVLGLHARVSPKDARNEKAKLNRQFVLSGDSAPNVGHMAALHWILR